MSFTRRAVEGVRNTRGLTSGDDPWSIPSNGSLSTYSSAGVPVDDNTVMSLLSVAACVRLLSETVAGLPFDAVKSQGKVRVPMDPAPKIVTDPFGGENVVNNGIGVTRQTGFIQLMISLLLRGNAYCNVAHYDEFGQPDMLQVLHPDAVQLDVNKTTGAREYKVNRLPFPTQRMLHIVGLSMPGQPIGMSLLSYAKRSIGLGIAAEEFGSMFFGSGAHMSGVIEIPGDLNRDMARGIKESFEANHSGMRHAHAVGVLTGGAKFTTISVTPEDAQFLATRSMQTTEIAMLFGIPPHMLGQVDRTTSWGKGIEEQTLGFLKFTLQGWVQRIENAFSAMMPDKQKARLNLDGLLRADSTTRYSAYINARNAAIMTPNEIRALENLPPVEGGDDLYAPLNSAHTTYPGWTPDAWLPGPTDPHTPGNSPLFEAEGLTPAGGAPQPTGGPPPNG